MARFADMYEMEGLLNLVEVDLVENFQAIYRQDGFKLLPVKIVARLTSNKKLYIILELDVLKSILVSANLSDLNLYKTKTLERISE